MANGHDNSLGHILATGQETYLLEATSGIN